MQASLLDIAPNKKSHYVSNHFDDRLDDLMDIAKQLMNRKGVYHLGIHFSSSQLVCWTSDNPYNYQVFTAEAVFADDFADQFASSKSQMHTQININEVESILESLKCLRENKGAGELLNASIHMVNGMIGLTFACDDTRYINYKDYMLPLTLRFPL